MIVVVVSVWWMDVASLSTCSDAANARDPTCDVEDNGFKTVNTPRKTIWTRQTLREFNLDKDAVPKSLIPELEIKQTCPYRQGLKIIIIN